MLKPRSGNSLSGLCPAFLLRFNPCCPHLYVINRLDFRIQRTRRATEDAGEEITQVTSSVQRVNIGCAHIDTSRQIQQFERMVGAHLNTLSALNAGCQKFFFAKRSRRSQQSLILGLFRQLKDCDTSCGAAGNSHGRENDGTAVKVFHFSVPLSRICGRASLANRTGSEKGISRQRKFIKSNTGEA